MFKIGDIVLVKHDRSKGAVIAIDEHESTIQYRVLVNGIIGSYFESQLEAVTISTSLEVYSAQEVNALLTARLLLNPNINSLYSLNTAKINFIPFQFRPVLKVIKSDCPRILIADGVGVGKTIEAGLILKELEARFDIKSVLVICPRPLITEKKWQNELKDKFGENFKHLDGATLRYCLSECYAEEAWPLEYQKCIVPYSLFDEVLVNGDSKSGKRKSNEHSLSSLSPFPKFDLVIIDEAHHIKNPNTYAYAAAQKFCDNANSVVLLTATPIQLGDQDLYVLLKLLRPDLVFDYESFKHMAEPNPYINDAIKFVRGNKENWQELALESLLAAGNTAWGIAMLTTNNTYIRAIKLLKSNHVSDEQRVGLITDLEGLHTFARLINRTRRRDIGNFTLRKPETKKVYFTEKQAELYNKLLDTQAKILIQLHGDRCIKFMMTTIMRQAASCIYGLKPFIETILTRRLDELEVCDGGQDSDDYDSLYENATIPQIKDAIKEILSMASDIDKTDYKLDALIKTILDKQSMQKNKVMVFSNFRHTLKYLYDNLIEKNIRVGVVHGGVKDEERVHLRHRFMLDKSNPNSIDVLLFSEVGCEGLDYQFCDCMVNYDLPWNPQAIEQRIGRIDRNGQESESVSIVNIITAGTIDCDIYERCLSRIGVFNASIGDSEEILGEITKGIYDIVESYTLTPDERREKLQQLRDNKVRLIQETERMESEKHTFFGLDMSESVMKKELEDATNIHLSENAIVNLVETYFKKKLGDSKTYIVGSDKIKTLRLNEENRTKLLFDFNKLQRQINPTYRAWEGYLKGTKKFDKVIFDGKIAAENPDAIFVMPMHPLVKQAIASFEHDPVTCVLKTKDKGLPCGKYPFLVYEWQYKGIKPNCRLQVITEMAIENDVILNAIFNAESDNGMPIIDTHELETKHYSLWQKTKKAYIAEAEQIIGDRKQSLSVSEKALEHSIEEQIRNATDVKILRMKKSELEAKRTVYAEKMDTLNALIGQADIVAKKLVEGVLIIEE